MISVYAQHLQPKGKIGLGLFVVNPRLIAIIPDTRANQKMQHKEVILNKNLVEGHERKQKEMLVVCLISWLSCIGCN